VAIFRARRSGEVSRAKSREVIFARFRTRNSAREDLVLNFAQYNGVENAIFASGPGAGTDGPIFCCELQSPVGNLSTDAVIRAQFVGILWAYCGHIVGIPKQAAQQEFVVMAVTDALFQMGWSEAEHDRLGALARRHRDHISGLLKHREVNLFLKIVCIVDVQADLERVSVPPASQGIICSATQQSQR
jgi:hypothetical protein